MTIDLVDVDLSGVATKELEAGICGFQARLSAAAAVYVLAIAEYDRRLAWEQWECRSMAHFLSWRCGTGMTAAREQVRVGRALADLPVISERFAAGILTYSQARALTRVATPDTDEPLADMAEFMTAAQLERVVRAFRRSSRVHEETAALRRTRRRLNCHWNDEGMLVGTFALAAEEGAAFLKKLDNAVTPERVRGAEQDRAVSSWGAARADVLMEMAADWEPGAGGDDDSHLVTVLVDQATLAGDPGVDEDPVTCQVEDGPGLAAETARRLACHNPTVEVRRDGEGNVLDVGRRTRRIGRRLRRALALRDGGCRYPGCTSTRTQAHHIVHWADGGTTAMDNLVSLCSRHHHRHHEGGFRIERTGSGAMRFVQADGRLVPECGRRAPSPIPGGGLPATEGPFDCRWEGGSLPLDDILIVLHQAAGTLDGPGHNSAETSVNAWASYVLDWPGPAGMVSPLPGTAGSHVGVAE